MKVILALDVDLLQGTLEQLFQDLMDYNQDSEMICRGPDGEVYLHYGIAVETVVIEGTILMAEEAKEWPPGLDEL